MLVAFRYAQYLRYKESRPNETHGTSKWNEDYKGFAEKYTAVPWIDELLKQFDGIVLSGTIGMVKPERDIFDYTLKKFGLKGSESLFIDDSSLNIKGAESARLKGYLFDGNVEKLRKFLCLD